MKKILVVSIFTAHFSITEDVSGGQGRLQMGCREDGPMVMMGQKCGVIQDV